MRDNGAAQWFSLASCTAFLGPITGPHVSENSNSITIHCLHPISRDTEFVTARAARGALAEAFQSSRTIDRRHGEPFLTAVRFGRSLRLVDVFGAGAGEPSTGPGQFIAPTTVWTDHLSGAVRRHRVHGTVRTGR